eukprot:Seg4471.1 transcript_id=Seg4471.1/GoldUCD/mRNA.D3Y31 product="YrdC domain-containing protein mitochondrial" protein_id=Seg4471.1/GoldUCD/D3Y31
MSKINEKKIFISNAEIIQKTRIRASDIRTLHEAGRGSYGVAYKGILRRSNRAYEPAVATKCIKDVKNSHTTRATVTELKILHFFLVMKTSQVQYLYGAIFDEEKRWCDVTLSREILEELLPGPVTLVFERKAVLNPELNPSTRLVGVRIPDHQFIRETARICKEPIALTSANISASRSCLTVEEFKYLWPKLDVVFDGGCLGETEESRLGSTVIDLSIPGQYKIIRDGSALRNVEAILRDKHGLRSSS